MRDTFERSRRGFTLLELMLVMVILGTVVGVGLGAFASFDPGRRAARGLIASALRQARNEAVANRAPATVRIDPETRTLMTESYVVAGTWRFETSSLDGAGGEQSGFAEGFPGEYLGDGFVGRALDLELGPRGARVAIDLSDDPIFSVTRGFRIACALRPSALADAELLDYGGVVKWKLQRDGSVSFEVVTRRVDELGRSSAGESVLLRTSPGALEAGRWGRIELRYDGAWLTALAAGVPVAQRAEFRPLWNLTAPLVLGGGRTPYPGRIDDLVVSVMQRSDEMILPSSTEFEASAPLVVRFDGGGRLDPVEHARPATIGLVYEDGSRSSVTVQIQGTVE